MLRLSIFINDTATTDIYTLSLHDALPICTTHRSINRSTSEERRCMARSLNTSVDNSTEVFNDLAMHRRSDRKSTRLNSSHVEISYAVFCLKKKKKSYMTSAVTHIRCKMIA